MRHAPGGSQKIVAVASDENRALLAGQPKHLVIRRGDRKYFTQFDDNVVHRFKRVGDVIRHVLVEQELHDAGADI